MKHNDAYATVGSRKTHEPLASCAELAVEFGVSTRSLAAELWQDAEAPKPKIVARGTAKNSWYSPKEVRAWWRKRIDSLDKVG